MASVFKLLRKSCTNRARLLMEEVIKEKRDIIQAGVKMLRYIEAVNSRNRNKVENVRVLSQSMP